MTSSVHTPRVAQRVARAMSPSAITAVGILLLSRLAQGCAAARQSEYDSPDAAAHAFVTAVRNNDRDALRRMFGDSSDEIFASGDSVADETRRERFIRDFDQRNRLVPGSNADSMTLVVGNRDWPLPIPIVRDHNSGKWTFDTEAGRDEIINRRIGQNELDVIEVCQAIVDAQQEYVQRDPNADGVPEYAPKFLSDPGARNGLFWQTKSGEAPSPLGPLVAEAVDEGYTAPSATSGEPRPYHGYCYRMLTAQGPNASDGARDYLVNGRMLGGFAAVAYPADYGNSGIMTFIVNQDGDVFQRDLGPDTTSVVRSMKAFDPDPKEWRKVQPADAGAAASTVPTTAPSNGR